MRFLHVVREVYEIMCLLCYREVEPAMAGRAGMMMAFFLVLGITCGVNFSLIFGRIATV